MSRVGTGGLFTALCAVFSLVPTLLGQTPPNPVPFVHQPLVPTAVAPGGPDFTLTVNGAGFVPESAIQWNGSPRPTTFVSNIQLTAAIPASDIATFGSALITVVSPEPGGGVSNPVLFLTTFLIAFVDFRPMDFGTTGNAVGAAAADFNGDGKADLAMLLDNEVQVFLGNGDGSFQPAQSFARDGHSVFTEVGGIVACDLSRDGKTDLAVANYSTNENQGLGSISVSLGSGDGTFQPAVSYSIPAFRPAAIACADFNGDGSLDFAAPGLNTNSNTGDVGILLGTGDGTFMPGNTYSALTRGPGDLSPPALLWAT